MLFTTIPVNSIDEAIEKINWYADRWIIESFFKVLKSGCKIEERQFKTGNRLKSVITLDSIIAWRILFLTFIGRELPDIPASVIFEEYEWQSLHCHIHETNEPPAEVPSLQAVTMQIAKLGGFLGRKSDGHPGPITMYRGFWRLNDISTIYKIINKRNTYG